MFGFKTVDAQFFQLFEEAADIIYQGAILLKNMMDKYESIDKRLDELVALEQKGDKVTDMIIDKLNKTFITPFDREDIYSIARELNEIMDSICSTVEKMVIYEAGKPGDKFKEMVNILVRASENVKSMVYCIRKIKDNSEAIIKLFHEIAGDESLGDKVYRLGVADLFKKGGDAIDVIKWKEVFEQLETTLDRCEKVAKLIRGVVVKYA